MSGQRLSAPGERGALDASSRVVLRRFGGRVFFIAVITLLPCLAGNRSLHDGIGLAALAFSLGGTVSIMFAALCREPAGRGSLNGWDESLAFIAASRLTHIVFVLHG